MSNKKKMKNYPVIDRIGREFTDRAISTFDDIVEDNLTPDKDFDSYKDDMEDFTWGNVIGGI